MVYTYEFAMAPTTATVAVLTKIKGDTYILLGKRQDNSEAYPSAWCLPGGYIDVPEKTKDAAVRELDEETNINITTNRLNIFYIDDTPGSDPRYEQVINVCYYVFLNDDELDQVKAGDDLQAVRWIDINKIPKLAFDHNIIVEELKKILI